ncbi:response regulator transcription factor [Clostridium butyricum]|uniref:Stage 0 sporulation protein A homolog n=1 Tax=Clostridium butyricum E4 str. BoNT E BL5262 TaxID=632245 RepID=C4IJU8_CLOBU|nr:response regulator transcription factor [Clostridium butyricum]EDT74495.1 DNA-binding response regulator [Clostridium butyricum 5521]EEP54337.1 two component transcriptional regulator, winged helix family [Clostridium butyricum E4 str. BoNT E BL5262]NFL31804.1 response regulator transcription factor [Clostridium butyricum]NFS17906.1 response regulator transcription factor [Clostridium butyricum]
MSRIMIIEDNENLKKELIEFLSRYGYDSYGVEDYKNVVNIILNDKPDLVLLDINLPYYDGYFICREIRKNNNIPIIIVTSRDSDMDEIMSINLGADDFITKPYNTQVLLARIGSLLRRTAVGNVQDILEHKGLKLNINKGEVSFKDRSIDLSKNEFKILSCLIKNKETIVSREDLMDYLWNSDLFIDDNTLSVNVTRLRKKLDDLGFKNGIETKRGLGYILL